MANQRRRGAPRKIASAKALQRIANKYMDSISYLEQATRLEPSGEFDRYGHPIMVAVPQKNASGEVPELRKWIRLPSIEELCVEWLGVSPSTWSRWSQTDDLGPTCEYIKAQISIPWRQALEGQHVQGVIFNLERNFDMTQKQEITVTGNVEDYLQQMSLNGETQDL